MKLFTALTGLLGGLTASSNAQAPGLVPRLLPALALLPDGLLATVRTTGSVVPEGALPPAAAAEVEAPPPPATAATATATANAASSVAASPEPKPTPTFQVKAACSYAASVGACRGGDSPGGNAGLQLFGDRNCQTRCNTDGGCTGYVLPADGGNWCETYTSEGAVGDGRSDYTCYMKTTCGTQSTLYDQAAAEAYCAAMGNGWYIAYTDSVRGSLYCLANGIITNENCDDCSTYRIVVWTDGGGETKHDLDSYPFATTAGNVYSSHTNPCATGPNTLGAPCDTFDPITNAPTKAPTKVPTDAPSDAPTDVPTDAPSDAPTNVHSDVPTDAPTGSPTDVPSDAPTDVPTDAPSNAPTEPPTCVPGLVDNGNCTKPLTFDECNATAISQGHVFEAEPIIEDRMDKPFDHIPGGCFAKRKNGSPGSPEKIIKFRYNNHTTPGINCGQNTTKNGRSFTKLCVCDCD